MSFVKSKELQGILIAVTGYMLLSTAIYHLLGSFILKWPLWLIPLGMAIFLTSKYFSNRIPILNSDNYVAQVFHILVTMVSYTLFIKSLLYYISPLLQKYVWTMLFTGFILLIYAAKHHLKGVE
jgi:hypothetical protein